jgi:predicted esterase
MYQNYGEIDVFEAIDHVATHYPIDRDRITVTGTSMGGAAVWYLISHYPDVFAGAAPYDGYCDYRLWEKPGGMTIHLNEWEVPSWQSRSAVFLVENLEHTPVWIVHGEWDRAIGGGVSVEHSRQMARLMQARSYEHKYTEVPRIGHGSRETNYHTSRATTPEVVPWLLDQKKTQNPDHVSFTTYNLRHNRAYCVEIDQLAHYGKRGLVEVWFSGEGRVVVRTDGVRTLSLGPFANREASAVVIDDQDLGTLNVSRQQCFQRTMNGRWEVCTRDLLNEKRHKCSGPIGDLFFDQVILVPGTIGSEEETNFTTWVARNAQDYYRKRNGGVHRGGILGENSVELPVVNDRELNDDLFVNNNLLLYGTQRSNSILAQFDGQIPIAFDGTTIRLSDKSYTGARAAVIAVFPNPKNPERYVAVHGGVTPDAISWGSHLDMQLLPDYLVYSGGDLLDWGFWGNDWKSQK